MSFGRKAALEALDLMKINVELWQKYHTDCLICVSRSISASFIEALSSYIKDSVSRLKSQQSGDFIVQEQNPTTAPPNEILRT